MSTGANCDCALAKNIRDSVFNTHIGNYGKAGEYWNVCPG